MNITVIGSGRWGSFIAWYLNKIGHNVTVYGRPDSQNFKNIVKLRTNGTVQFDKSINFTDDTASALSGCEITVISINSQGLRGLMRQLSGLDLSGKTFVLCMKGLEIGSGMRLTEVVEQCLGDSVKTAVWVGPGHVQQFLAGIPNCMVIDSKDQNVTDFLINLFSSDLIRFYYGRDIIGSEIGAASKNVIGIAAGILDGLSLSSLKGALMSRATREIARLIRAMGGNELSAYGLCHLGDYEATLFSEFSHNRQYGQMHAKGLAYDKLAEGYYTAKAITELASKYYTDLPICNAVYDTLYNGVLPQKAVDRLFSRQLKDEFYI